MLDQLRGRNLAHVGCTIGLVLGLTLGLIAAVVIINLITQPVTATNVATAVWLGLTAVLGVAGYWVGGFVSRRLWGERRVRAGDE